MAFSRKRAAFGPITRIGTGLVLAVGLFGCGGGSGDASAASGAVAGSPAGSNTSFAVAPAEAFAIPERQSLRLRASINHRYLRVDPAGRLVADAESAAQAASFEFVPAGDGLVALRALGSGAFVTVAGGGAQPLVAGGSAAGARERFAAIALGGHRIALRAAVNGRYVVAENAGTEPLFANREIARGWEHFELVTDAENPLLPPAGERTLFVAPGGRDGAPGTIEQPLLSLQAAIDRIADGQGGTIYLRGGFYKPPEQTIVDEATDGGENAWLVIRPYRDERVVLSGDPRLFQACLAVSGQYVAVAGVECIDAYRGFLAYGARHLRLLDNTVRGVREAGIAVWGPAQPGATRDIVIDGNTVHWASQRGWPGTGPRPFLDAAIKVAYASGVRITRNHAYENSGEGIDLASVDGFTVADNVVRDTAAAAIRAAGGRDGVIERNLAYGTGERAFWSDAGAGPRPAPGLEIGAPSAPVAPPGPVANLLVRNNVFVGLGWRLSPGASNGLQLIGNTLHTAVPGDDAAPIELGTGRYDGVEIAGNIFSRTGGGRTAAYGGVLGASSGFVLHHNLWSGIDPGAAQGVGDVISDAAFVNPNGTAAIDFRLRPQSPARNAGVPASPRIAEDYFGARRPATGAVAIGAVESD